RQRMALPGDPPSPMNPPSGCPFHPRCPFADARCTDVVPAFEERAPGQRAACIRLDYVAEQATRSRTASRESNHV
ncbi:MAG: hypothetical protein HYV26_01170, partial [Candidatus Hydrogenedentes bacterium]|nr:hypothetical protein [Candidatus Hydrogenedentota bacterium]